MSEQDDERLPNFAQMIGLGIFAVLMGSIVAAPTYAVLHFTFGLGVPLSATLAFLAGAASLFLTIKSEWGGWIVDIIAGALAMVFRWM